MAEQLADGENQQVILAEVSLETDGLAELHLWLRLREVDTLAQMDLANGKMSLNLISWRLLIDSTC
jgi:hypothetical protein